LKFKQEKISEFRKLSIYGFEMVGGGHNFYALLEFDITDLRKALRSQRNQGSRGSLFSFLLKAIGKCLEEYPEFNAMINLKRKTTFYEVDIDIPIEVQRGEEIYNKQHIIRDINRKTLAEVDAEIRKAKGEVNEEKSYMAWKFGQKLMMMLPKSIVLFIFRQILKNHEMVKKYSGTVFVTSVSMFSNVPGFVIPFVGGPKAVSFAIGSVTKKPVVKNDEIQIREMINITTIFNHDLVDGAPAARFINRLRRYVEQGYASFLSRNSIL
jgi:pyruvate/2-oxoglutarate dehydrogenase complex dihydrolipoamide acyltransferase (E2) component